MKGSKLALIFILCALLIAGIACGGKSESPTPTPTSTAIATPTPTPQPPIAAKAIVNGKETESGSRINLSIGDTLNVTLESNPGSTGYSWNISAISNTSVVKKVSNVYIAPTPTDPPIVGQAGKEVWTFEAIASGTADIAMIYFQPWQPQEPARIFNITVNVK